MKRLNHGMSLLGMVLIIIGLILLAYWMTGLLRPSPASAPQPPSPSSSVEILPGPQVQPSPVEPSTPLPTPSYLPSSVSAGQ